jgi:hypothetical protein
MSRPDPIYTRDNCSFSSPLHWGLTVFWREPMERDDWFPGLAAATEPDGIRLLGHRFEKRHNLHVVLVHRERWNEVREDVLASVRDMVVRAAEAKGYLLSRAGVLADHVHLLLGCPIDVAPDEVALGFLNNLAFAQGMRPVYQYGAFVGTVGEYTTGALKSETPPRGDESHGGEEM